ncbi:hypothetical protein FACS1894139_02390 [Planctomycetales bacterium]|nr:hypothetical protein FACS1894107_15570 [Planctomycetales bacterium]GHT03034.1 hypothetical protein FACS1894139_02390 [Planctomycetales bacterium]
MRVRVGAVATKKFPPVALSARTGGIIIKTRYAVNPIRAVGAFFAAPSLFSARVAQCFGGGGIVTPNRLF